MKNSNQFERLLKQAFSPTVEPNEDLNQKIISQLKENDIMKPAYRKRISGVLVAATLIFTMSIGAFATWHFLSPKQVADNFEDKTLAHAFDDENAIEINESVVSGGYSFTLLGIVSGEGLSDFRHSAEDIHPNRTYAVVSIAKEDGSKMPDTQDEEYGQVPFFISPLIKGQKPWQVNIASMNGAYSECVIDGIMYRLIECDGVEIFADRGLYLCISTSNFYDINAFNYNEETGEITLNTDYNGANALFNLPLDITKANQDKAEKYLQELLKEDEADFADSEELDIFWAKLEDEIKNGKGIVIPESVKEVTYDEYGMACYEYKDEDGSCYEISFDVDGLFEEGETGVSEIQSINESRDGEGNKEVTVVQFTRDAQGVITGMVIELKVDQIDPLILDKILEN
ncbi:hypothetical protein [Maledivibacter halophilus]|uniref:DUF4179 domain-containing protein n=1 Tax=Maledivibacter halophilus TaxID=36842 RepID=A0A1T5MMP3_9FIRM|nr:hypothetical protein [Maledivibacter halophilus]SKC89274.1 hypothetical protein SAMN02194393_04997 [Maledivibacter halophilus]